MKRMAWLFFAALIAATVLGIQSSAASDEVRAKDDLATVSISDSSFALSRSEVSGEDESGELSPSYPVEPVEPSDDPEIDEGDDDGSDDVDIDEEFPDTDGDAVPDEDDECVDEPGSVFNFGCPVEDEDDLADLQELSDAIDDVAGEGAGMAFVGSCSLAHGAAANPVAFAMIALALAVIARRRSE